MSTKVHLLRSIMANPKHSVSDYCGYTNLTEMEVVLAISELVKDGLITFNRKDKWQVSKK